MRTPGNSDEMSSLRAEHAGIISLLLALLFFQSQIQPSAISITIHVDSAVVLDRIEHLPTKALKDHDVLDYDLWILQHYLLKKIDFHLKWTKIKSHATEKQRLNQGLIPSQLNEQVDTWATEAQQMRYGPRAFPVPQVPITPMIQDSCIQGPIRPHFQLHATKGKLQQ